MMKDLLVLGAGSAGLLAALAIRRRLPGVAVRILRSPEIAVIGVGESTTPNVPGFLFDFLGIPPRQFFELAEPTFKLGIHFLWGPRPSFNYPFALQLDVRYPQLPRPNGYYCDEDFSCVNAESALMDVGKAFARLPNGTPNFTPGYAFHLDNAKFIKALLAVAQQRGIEFVDGMVAGTEKGPQGVSALVLEDGRKLTADFFIDASGFRSELLGKAMEEPFINYEKSLLNDRALLATWNRSDEPILPYTMAETMDAGWAWQIEHEDAIHRGYVFSSNFISDDQAREEFARKNPRARINDRVVRFKSGRYRNGWAGNVMGVGNACGFAEPLEATALMLICWQCQTFIDFVEHVGQTPSIRDLYNQTSAMAWDEVRDFLTLHFKINTRLQTPYWHACREEADTSSVQGMLSFFQENGPTGFSRYKMTNRDSQFGIEGYLVQLVGNKVPYHNRHQASEAELQLVHQTRMRNRATAVNGMTVKETLAMIRHPGWRWANEIPAPSTGTPAQQTALQNAK